MKPLFLLPLLGLPLLAAAQSAPPAPPARHATVLDLTAAAGPTLNAASVAGWRLWGLDAGGRFQAGLGLRASHYFAAVSAFDGQTGPAGVVLTVAEPRALALNAAFQVRARVAGPVGVGFSLDVAGLTVGPDRPGERVYPPGVERPPVPVTPGVPLRPAFDRTEPVGGNLLLGGLRDRGSLNSELYVSAALPAGFSLRAGYCHLVTAQSFDGERYRRFRDLASLGLSWQLP